MASTRPLAARPHATAAAPPAAGVITRTELPGGLRVVTEAMPGVRSASVGIWVGVGSRDETPALAGTSHFLEHLLFKGTRTRTRAGHRVGDGRGRRRVQRVHREGAHLLLRDRARPRPAAGDRHRQSDVVLDATVRADDVDVERSVVLEEIAMRDDDPSDLVHDEFSAALFGDTPLGRPILGTVESINALTRAQIAGYYRRRYQPGAMVVAGGRQRRPRRGRAAGPQGLRRPARRAPRPAPRAPAPRRQRRARPARSPSSSDDTEQANIVLGMRGLSRHDDRRFALGVLSAALGGGMSSRLFQSIREQRGLAYSVYSFTSSYADTGAFGVYAGCQPGKADEVLELITDDARARSRAASSPTPRSSAARARCAAAWCSAWRTPARG